MSDGIIIRPNRETVCELFPIAANYALDEQGRRELRTVNEFWSLVKPIFNQQSDIYKKQGAEFHLNSFTQDFITSLNGRTWSTEDNGAFGDYVTDRAAASTPEQFFYYIKSCYFTSLLRSVGIRDEQGIYQMTANLSVLKTPMEFAGELAIVGSVLRKYPFIRFDVFHYVQFVTHYEGDVDKYGCPRVSIDGYRNI